MIKKDWVLETCNDIIEHVRSGTGPLRISALDICDIITKHCPSTPGVAYMPVPRCDGCKHWDPAPRALPDGICRNTSGIWFTGGEPYLMTAPGFGCIKWEGLT